MAPHARIVNLETAVTTHAQPWPHKGINYRMHPGAAARAGGEARCERRGSATPLRASATLLLRRGQ